jgi:hypothetical protein
MTEHWHFYATGIVATQTHLLHQAASRQPGLPETQATTSHPIQAGTETGVISSLRQASHLLHPIPNLSIAAILAIFFLSRSLEEFGPPFDLLNPEPPGNNIKDVNWCCKDTDTSTSSSVFLQTGLPLSSPSFTRLRNIGVRRKVPQPFHRPTASVTSFPGHLPSK